MGSIFIYDVSERRKLKSIAAVTLVGGVAILVNNAGAFAFQNWDAATPEDWASVYNGNVLAAVRMIRLISKQMKDRGWGRIIQITSGESVQPSNRAALGL